MLDTDFANTEKYPFKHKKSNSTNLLVKQHGKSKIITRTGSQFKLANPSVK